MVHTVHGYHICHCKVLEADFKIDHLKTASKRKKGDKHCKLYSKIIIWNLLLNTVTAH